MTNAIQYLVKDPQGSIYGPADIPTLRQWIREGRIIATMQIAAQGTLEWQIVGQHPQLADLFAAPASAAQAPVGSSLTPAAVPIQPGAYSAPLGYSATPATNGMAIAALICSLIPCTPIPPILGIVFGMMAKSQIRASNGAQTGEGLATAGIIIGIIHLVLGCLVIGLWIAAAASQGHMR